MKRILPMILVLLLLSSCVGVVPDGVSIEDCIEKGLCNYNNNDVTTEGSELSMELMALMLFEDDQFTFNFGINPGGAAMSYTYASNEPFTHALLDDFITLMKDATVLTDNRYEIIEYTYNIQFEDGFIANPHLDENYELEYLSFSFDGRLTKSIETDTEAEILSHLEDTMDEVKSCIDYAFTDHIYWYGNALLGIHLVVTDVNVILHISDDIYSDAIEQYILAELSDYNIRFTSDTE